MVLFSKKGIEIFKNTYHEISKIEDLKDKDFSYLIQKIIDKGIKVNCLEIHKGWTEVHSFQDYKNVASLIK